jgi:hypothetical protein
MILHISHDPPSTGVLWWLGPDTRLLQETLTPWPSLTREAPALSLTGASRYTTCNSLQLRGVAWVR